MRSLKQILGEQQEVFRLNNTQKGIIASIAVSATPELAYGVITGARNAVDSADELERLGYISVNNETKEASLTSKGEDILTSENLTDETGELTERGEELVARFRTDKGEWAAFESIRRFI